MRPEILARAIALDDQYPDTVCPGCKQDIAGWEDHEAHMQYESSTAYFTRANMVNICPWTSDYLAARQHRRRYIAAYQELAS